MRIEINGRKLPGLTVNEHTNVYIAIQRGKENIEAFPADAASVSWSFECRTVETPDSIDFRGDYIQGKRDERFVYLSWGDVDAAGAFNLFGRIKLMLDGVPPEVLSQALQPGTHLIGNLELTSPKGEPRYAAVRPPAIEWTVTFS